VLDDDSTAADPARVKELFEQVVHLPPAEARAFLDQACKEDRGLRREVMELLAFDPKKNAPRDAAEPPEPREPPGAEPDDTKPARRTRQATRAEALPAQIGRFSITGKLGAGGMGVVYEGRDPTLGRPVALKLVLGGGGSEGKARLLREAQAMARVSHPNVVPVYEVGLHGEDVFVAMELVQGETLTAWLKKEPRSWRETLGKLVQAGRGLAAAHEAGVLHRDFKPDNVLVGTDGRARVLDFGLARSLNAVAGRDEAAPAATDLAALDDALTQEGVVMGTPVYMSPEHFDGPLGPASDQWSFAVSAYRTLFGELPFKGSIMELRAKVQEPAPMPAHHEDMPPLVVSAVMRGLARRPEDRFPSMNAMTDELESVLLLDPESDGSISRRQRRRAAVAIAILGAANFVVAGVRTSFRFDIGLPGVTLQGFVGLVFTLGTIAFFRKAFLKTRYNRRIITFLVLILTSHFLHRVYELRVGGNMTDTLRIDALYTISLGILATVAIERWCVWQVLLASVYLLATFFSDWIVAPGFGMFLIASIAFGIYYWREPRRRSDGSIITGSSGSGGTPRSRT
jgi:serine/threonine-protein kinase